MTKTIKLTILSVFTFLFVNTDVKAQAANGNYPGTAVIHWNISHTGGTLECLFSAMTCYSITFNHWITIYTAGGNVNGWVPMAYDDPNWSPEAYEVIEFEEGNPPG